MHPHERSAVLEATPHRIRGQLDVEDAVVIDVLPMEAESTGAGQPPADAAGSDYVDVRVGQRIPGLAHPNEPILRDQQANGLVVESHPPQVGSARDPSEDHRLPLESHRPSLAVHAPRRSGGAPPP